MEWFYLDNSGSSKGPVSTETVEKLLRVGVTLKGSNFVWRTGFDKWQPCAEVEEFKSIVKLLNMQWYYLEADGTQKGPIYTRNLTNKFQKGDLNGMSMVFSHDLGEWKHVFDIPELKAEISFELDEDNHAMPPVQATAVDVFNQVFEANEEADITDRTAAYQKQLQEEKQRALAESEKIESSGKKRTFVADNGLKYCWDEAENDWVQDDSISDEEDEQNDDGEDDEHNDDDDNNLNSNRNPALTANGKRKRNKKKKPKKMPNNWVYVTGLPTDITFEEIKSHFSKVGLIAISPVDQLPKIKLYKDESGVGKGDCSLCYNAEASVGLAVDILNGGYIRPGALITVSKANFQPQGEVNPSLQGNKEGSSNGNQAAPASSVSKRPKLSHAQVKVAQSAMKQALSWNEDDDIGVNKSQALKIVVLKGMFSPSDFDVPTFSDELEEDIAGECSKCGVIDKITVFSKNPQGIIIVKFHTAYAAQECVKLMDNRFFGGSKIRCFFWDGSTDYTVHSSGDREEEADRARLDEFGDWLEKDQEDLPEEFRVRVEN